MPITKRIRLNHRVFIAGLLLVSLLLILPASHAATFCIRTEADFDTAFLPIRNNGEDDTVLIETGVYTGGFNFELDDDHGLTILGGYTTFFNIPCGVRSSRDPADTVLDGAIANRALRIAPDDTGDVWVDLLTFRNGGTELSGGGLRIDATAGYNGNVTITRNLFEYNRAAQFGGGFSGGSDLGIVRIRNNVFRFNTALASGAASINTNARALIANNTVAFNFVNSGSGSQPGGLRLGAPSDGLTQVANNIFWGNENADLVLNVVAELRHNIYGVLAGGGGLSSGSNNNWVGVDPGFRNKTWPDFDLRLRVDSPAIDAGRTPFCPLFVSHQRGLITINCDRWGLEAYDLNGLPRTMGGGVDIGAYESDLIFLDSFDG